PEIGQANREELSPGFRESIMMLLAPVNRQRKSPFPGIDFEDLLQMLTTGCGTLLPIPNVRLYVRSRRRSGRAIDIAKATFMTLRRQSPNQLRERPARVSQLRKGQRRRLHQFDTRRRFCAAVSRCAQLGGPLDDAVEYDGLVAKLVLGGRV